MTVNFGFKKVKEEEKEKMVQGVFSKVANKYDIMNDMMSFGLHRKWKDIFVNEIDSYEGMSLLDLAGGTGDIAKRFIDKGGEKAIVSDLNNEMLHKGKSTIGKKINKRYINDIKWIHCSAENIPYADNSFDYCTISFGIRNVTHVKSVLRESLRILKPGGKFLCLEFSKVDNNIISKIYDFYSFKIIPKIGSLVAKSSDSYQYLVESIKQFHHPEELEIMMKDGGYFSVNHKKLFFGVVAIHSGYKA